MDAGFGSPRNVGIGLDQQQQLWNGKRVEARAGLVMCGIDFAPVSLDVTDDCCLDVVCFCGRPTGLGKEWPSVRAPVWFDV
ncbi:autophagy-related protein 16-2 isoform X3 [Anopheles sinensis]|uniref:Autophagy-related protein 16-2 isoform X3 n=1 Tax=Anopheles sinensis TaxID=74873 RepID=A0A084W5E2_ANOSI|nr:autophagy-related protein 16-2 isoform X3 [Anopheles sinensis]